MRIFLSRKGFDYSAGGCASPIIDLGNGNKQFLSLPIPDNLQAEEVSDSTRKYHGRLYSELSFNYEGKQYSYSKLVKDLSGISRDYCHLDPDINENAWGKLPTDWIPGFGPLKNEYTKFYKDVQEGDNDIILFFGWFREIMLANGEFIFKKGAPDIHAIYGYMQIGKKVMRSGKDKLYWHPHADEKDNCIFTPTDRLTINDEKTDYKGYGLFQYNEDTILTKSGCPRSYWREDTPFVDDSICKKQNNDKYGDFFVKRGWKQWQEYRYDNDETIEKIIKWLENMLRK